MTESRFIDDHSDIYDFMDEILVECPKCSACARVFQIDREATSRGLFAPRRLSCLSCGLSKDWEKKEIARQWHGEPKDDYFELPLWLQADCIKDKIWAYNERHLDYIKAFVESKHRDRSPDEKWGWSNQSFASRLPKWIKSAKNRDELLAAIEKMRSKIKPAAMRT